MKILIAGAGPTGLTTGVELVRRGIQVEIIDKRDGGSTLSRAVGINPQSLEILKPSGVTGKLLAQGVRFNSIRIFRDNRPWVTLPLTAAPIRHGFNFMLGLPQDKTEAILRETFLAGGGTLTYGKELVGVRNEANEVVVETAEGDELSCGYLVGADGVRSATREAVGIQSIGHALPGVWSIADVDIEGWEICDAAAFSLMSHGRMAGIVPLGGNRFRLVSNTENVLSVLPFDVNVTLVRREAKFNIRLSQVKEYSKGRVYLAGDAAHSQSPAGGRGMNLGIVDGANLASRLAGGDLSDYSRVRFEEGKRLIAGAERMRLVMTSRNPILRGLVLAGMKAVAMVPLLQRRVASTFLYG
jgi:2-polyprenyl-6-methoxyphenol hydroxylase-like FAD-dependent oxidoreductase